MKKYLMALALLAVVPAQAHPVGDKIVQEIKTDIGKPVEQSLANYIATGDCGENFDITFIMTAVDHAGMIANMMQTELSDWANRIEVLQLRADWELTLADAVKGKGCLDYADQLYRHVLASYIGPLWQGYRDRAMVGIADIRAVR
jgi:hypothetical protein